MVVSQPRRVAAINLARRVAEELDVSFGEEVGYTIRFDDHSSPSTKILYITDGCLVRSLISDPLLSAYSLIMLDEAHERSLNSDILFGLCKRLLSQRSDLRLLIASATLNTAHFQSFYPDSCVLSIPGRMYPVAVFHSKTDLAATQDEAIDRAFRTFQLIHRREPGHVLLFLPGQAEIEKAAARIDRWCREETANDPSFPRVAVIPLYAALSAEQQARAFRPVAKGVRKLVIATTIAETSVTIPGIRFVIDPGFAREKNFDARTGMDSLDTVRISRVSAQQRAGRAGRTGPGKCFRLYSSAEFERMKENREPEIRRCSLLSTMLYLKVLGIDDVLGFAYLDAPAPEAISLALKQLFILGALDAEGRVTSLGARLAALPVDPQLGKTLLLACEAGCADEAIAISAMLSVERVFQNISPREAGSHHAQHVLRRQKRLSSELGDHFTYLNVYKQRKAASV